MFRIKEKDLRGKSTSPSSIKKRQRLQSICSRFSHLISDFPPVLNIHVSHNSHFSANLDSSWRGGRRKGICRKGEASKSQKWKFHDAFVGLKEIGLSKVSMLNFQNCVKEEKSTFSEDPDDLWQMRVHWWHCQRRNVIGRKPLNVARMNDVPSIPVAKSCRLVQQQKKAPKY